MRLLLARCMNLATPAKIKIQEVNPQVLGLLDCFKATQARGNGFAVHFHFSCLNFWKARSVIVGA